MKVEFKDEGPGGPLWINGNPVLGTLGGPIWFTHEQAHAIAHALGTTLVEA